MKSFIPEGIDTVRLCACGQRGISYPLIDLGVRWSLETSGVVVTLCDIHKHRYGEINAEYQNGGCGRFRAEGPSHLSPLSSPAQVT